MAEVYFVLLKKSGVLLKYSNDINLSHLTIDFRAVNILFFFERK